MGLFEKGGKDYEFASVNKRHNADCASLHYLDSWTAQSIYKPSNDDYNIVSTFLLCLRPEISDFWQHSSCAVLKFMGAVSGGLTFFTLPNCF